MVNFSQLLIPGRAFNPIIQGWLVKLPGAREVYQVTIIATHMINQILEKHLSLALQSLTATLKKQKTPVRCTKWSFQAIIEFGKSGIQIEVPGITWCKLNDKK